MTFSQYRNGVLGVLPLRSRLSRDRFASVFPYLTDEQINQSFYAGTEEIVAAPPLIIGECTQLLRIKRDFRPPDRLHVEEIYHHRAAARLIELAHNYPFSSEAREFAQKYWGDRLIDAPVEDYSGLEIFVKDPANQPDGNPTRVLKIYIILKVAMDELRRALTRLSPLDELDEKIWWITSDIYEWYELRTCVKARIETTNCVHCGYPLHRTECPHCRITFEDNFFHDGWNAPLSERMMGFLHSQLYSQGEYRAVRRSR